MRYGEEMTPKQQIQALLDQIPDHASFAQIQQHLNSYGGHRSWTPEPQPPRDGATAFNEWQQIVSI